MDYITELSPNVIYLYANKLTLFILYTSAFAIQEQNAYIGTLIMLLILVGHLKFLARVNF